MKLSVVIPSYNGKHLLETAIPSLITACSSYAPYEIIVVDNGSTDLSAEYLREAYPDVNVVALPYNTGFTGAVNAGVKTAFGDVLLIINNDCYLPPEGLSAMMGFLEANPQYVATQPIVYKEDGSVENIGFVVDLWIGKAFPVTDPKATTISEGFQVRGDDTRYIYGLSGACLLIRKEAFTEAGMLDETFHSYLEDVDLALRLVAKGKKVFPTIAAACVHQHMSTSSGMGSYKEQRDFRNWIRIIRKHYPSRFLLRHAGTLFVERLRNANGLLKKVLQ
jgi:GT2 family glycosyltransferase